MEARLRKKAGDYVTAFKNDIREKILEMPLSNDSANELLSYIYAYEQIDFSKEDFEMFNSILDLDDQPLYDFIFKNQSLNSPDKEKFIIKNLKNFIGK